MTPPELREQIARVAYDTQESLRAKDDQEPGAWTPWTAQTSRREQRIYLAVADAILDLPALQALIGEGEEPTREALIGVIHRGRHEQPMSDGEIVGSIYALYAPVLVAKDEEIRALTAECVSRDRVMNEQDSKLKAADAELAALREEVSVWEQLADLQRKRETPWVERWRQETGKADTLPDYGEMLAWLVAGRDEERAAYERIYLANEEAQTQRIRESHANTDLARSNRALIDELSTLRAAKDADERARDEAVASVRELEEIVSGRLHDRPGVKAMSLHDVIQVCDRARAVLALAPVKETSGG